MDEDSTATNILRWISEAPGSFQNWRRPRNQFLVFDKGQANVASVFGEHESLLQPQISSRMCAAFVIYSSLQLEWVSVPCSQTFTNVLLICQHRDRHFTMDRRTLPRRQHTECPHDWVFTGDVCHQMIDIQGTVNLSCHDLVGICQQYGASLSSRIVTSDSTLRILYHLIGWSHGTETVIFAAREGTKQRECGAWQILQRLTPVMAEVNRRNNGSVLCEQDLMLVRHGGHFGHFLCSDVSFILSHYVCDGIPDCFDGSDEADCLHVCKFKSEIASINRSCFKDCFPENCTCHDLYHQCRLSGGCVPASKLCDGSRDCRDGEDEEVCPASQAALAAVALDRRFKCSDGTMIPASVVNDLIPDCPGTQPKDEVLLHSYWLNTISDTFSSKVQGCSNTSTSCIDGFPLKCYPRNKICVFEMDRLANKMKYCRNGGHLSNCLSHVCPSMYKCPQSYCIPFHYVCNGRIDCPQGEDEQKCNTSSCPGLLKCRHDDVCVHPNAVGDGDADCPISRDDEALLHVVRCPTGCLCIGYAVMCSNANWTDMSRLPREMRKIVFVGHMFLPVLNFPIALYVNLANNSIKELFTLRIRGLYNVIHLILSENNIQRLGAKQFYGLAHLRVLDLHMKSYISYATLFL